MTSPSAMGGSGVSAAPTGHPLRLWGSRLPLGRRDALALPVLILAALLLGLAALLRRPDLYANGGFLFGDHGLNLFVTGRILEGASLYADVAYQYGPLAAYGFAGWAALVGNSVASFNGFLLTVSLLNLALAYLLLRRFASPEVALLIAGMGLVPTLLVPGALLGGYTVSAYLPLERTVLLLVALAWSPPHRRAVARAGALGVFLGIWQGVKFGGAIFAGVAVFLLDLIALLTTRRENREWSLWIRSLLVTLAGFLAVQALLAGYAFLTLPARVAADFLWPVYAVEGYAAWMVEGDRWPSWGGWSLFLGQYLTPLVGGAVGVALLVLLLLRRDAGSESSTRAALPLLLPLLFFVVAGFGYFRQVHHFLQFAWVLVIPAAWWAQRGSVRTRALIALLFLPCLAVNLKAVLVNRPAAGLSAVETPAGEVLWLGPGHAEDLAALLRLAGSGGEDGDVPEQPPELVFMPIGAGMEHFYGVPLRTRQVWFLPGFVRPYDEPDLLRALERGAGAVVIPQVGHDLTATDVCGMLGGKNPFSAEACEGLRRQLRAPRQVGDSFLYFAASSGG